MLRSYRERSVTVVIYYCLRKPKQTIIVRDYLKIRPDMTLILAIGVPAGIENGMFQFGKLAVQSTVSTLGTMAMSAQAMTDILELVNGIFSNSVGIGLMTVVGQCIGARRTEEAKYYMVKLMGVAGISVLVISLLLSSHYLTKHRLSGHSIWCFQVSGNDTVHVETVY